jgi:GNAT superfamily N-acetyltransferase
LRVVVPAEGAVLDEILAATYDIWHEGLTRDAYRQYYNGQLKTPWARAHLRRWALVDGVSVLASAKIYAFDAVLDGRGIRIVGLGAVFTQPAHRGQGHARELIDRLLTRAANDGFDLALLFSEIGTDYYARLGFSAIPTSDLALRVREDSRRGAPATLVRFGDDRDLPDIAAMWDARTAGSRFHLRRTRDLVHYAIAKKRLLAGLSAPGDRGVEFFVAEEGGSAVAYVVMSTRAGLWTLEEAGDRDPAGARLGAILQTLIARDPAAERPRILAWLPSTLRPPQIDIISEDPMRDVMMIKPLTEAGTPTSSLDRDDVIYSRGDLF